MSGKSRFIVYDRKEVAALTLLGLTFAAFTFTLGVHYGKRVNPPTPIADAHGPASAGSVEDPIPNRQEFVEQAKGIPLAADDALNQALHAEVVRTGVKLDVPRQVELPEQPRSKLAGATTLKPRAELKKLAKNDEAHSEEPSKPSRGKYVLQVGSHLNILEARKQVDALESSGLKAYLRATDVPNLGRRYRVFIGGFASKDDAQVAGTRYKSRKWIDSFVIATRGE